MPLLPRLSTIGPSLGRSDTSSEDIVATRPLQFGKHALAQTQCDPARYWSESYFFSAKKIPIGMQGVRLGAIAAQKVCSWSTTRTWPA